MTKLFNPFKMKIDRSTYRLKTIVVLGVIAVLITFCVGYFMLTWIKTENLIAGYWKLKEDCYDANPVPNECDNIVKYEAELLSRGWCLWKVGESMADRQWHKCGPDENREGQALSPTITQDSPEVQGKTIITNSNIERLLNTVWATGKCDSSVGVTKYLRYSKLNKFSTRNDVAAGAIDSYAMGSDSRGNYISVNFQGGREERLYIVGDSFKLGGITIQGIHMSSPDTAPVWVNCGRMSDDEIQKLQSLSEEKQVDLGNTIQDGMELALIFKDVNAVKSFLDLGVKPTDCRPNFDKCYTFFEDLVKPMAKSWGAYPNPMNPRTEEKDGEAERWRLIYKMFLDHSSSKETLPIRYDSQKVEAAIQND